MQMVNKIVRVGSNFNKEIESIKDERIKKGVDRTRVSTRKLTDLLIKHTAWQDIKEDLKTFLFNKGGFTSALNTIILVIALFFIVILLGIFGLVFYYSNLYLGNIGVVGQTNVTQINEDTFGQIADAYIGKMDLIGYFIIFALILGMIVNAYYTRGKHPLLMIIIDIFLLVFAYIVAVYVSNIYYLFINSSSILDIYINNLPKSSAFILHLPIYVSIIGVVMIVVSYIPIPRSANEMVQNEELEGIG